MLPCYEPLDTSSQLLGMEWVRASGAWPQLRHVFECSREAGLVVDVDPLGEAHAYAVAYSFADGDIHERFNPL